MTNSFSSVISFIILVWKVFLGRNCFNCCIRKSQNLQYCEKHIFFGWKSLLLDILLSSHQILFFNFFLSIVLYGMDLIRTLVHFKVGKIPMQRYSMEMRRRKNGESHQFTSLSPPTLPCKVEKLDLFDFVNSHFSRSTSLFLQTRPQDFHRNVLRRHFVELRLSKLDCYGKTPQNADKWWPTGEGWIL